MTEHGVEWPEGFASLYSAAVPGSMIQQLQREARSLADCPNFWMPAENLSSSTLTTAEEVVSHLHRRIASAAMPQQCAGAEWWVQVYQPGKGLAFHFDKDEHAMKECREMIHPILSSVLYLTGDATQGRLGPTVVLDQFYDCDLGKAVPDSPSRTALVYPRKNNYVMFDGRLGHGVLDSPCQQPRMTLLINWWAEKPQGIDRITDEHIQIQSLSRPSAKQAGSAQQQEPVELGGSNEDGNHQPDNQLSSNLQGLALSASPAPQEALPTARSDPAQAVHADHCQVNTQTGSLGASSSSAQTAAKHNGLCSNAQEVSTPPQQDQPESASGTPQPSDASESNSNMPEGSGVAFEASSLDEASSSNSKMCRGAKGQTQPATAAPACPAESQKTGQPRRLRVPAVSIAGWDDSPTLVDDVLGTYKLKLCGPDAIDAVAIDHTGFELFPLDDQNVKASGDNTVTAAAFVPAGTLSNSSSDSDSDSEG